MEVLDVSVKRDSGTAMDGSGSSAPGHPLPNFTDVFQVQDAILSRSLLTLVMSLTSNELAGDAGYSLEVSPCVDGAGIRGICLPTADCLLEILLLRIPMLTAMLRSSVTMRSGPICRRRARCLSGPRSSCSFSFLPTSFCRPSRVCMSKTHVVSDATPYCSRHGHARHVARDQGRDADLRPARGRWRRKSVFTRHVVFFPPLSGDDAAQQPKRKRLTLAGLNITASGGSL